MSSNIIPYWIVRGSKSNSQWRIGLTNIADKYVCVRVWIVKKCRECSLKQHAFFFFFLEKRFFENLGETEYILYYNVGNQKSLGFNVNGFTFWGYAHIIRFSFSVFFFPFSFLFLVVYKLRQYIICLIVLFKRFKLQCAVMVHQYTFGCGIFLYPGLVTNHRQILVLIIASKWIKHFF